MQERVRQKEEEMESIEKREKDRKIQFMEAWKEKEERKRKQKKVQQGWKDLLESVEYWEELQEGETEYTDENLEEWFEEEWSEEGFKEAGTVLELVITDVIAFIEMCGTVTTNNYHQQEYEDKAVIELLSEPLREARRSKNNGQWNSLA